MSTGNVIRGHKAAISNPNTSQATKEHSRQVIQELEGQGADAYPPRQSQVALDEEDEEKEEATVKTKPSSGAYHESVLGDTKPALGDDAFAGKDPNRVLGGYKATLHNPNTSQDAKDRAKAALEQSGLSAK